MTRRWACILGAFAGFLAAHPLAQVLTFTMENF